MNLYQMASDDSGQPDWAQCGREGWVSGASHLPSSNFCLPTGVQPLCSVPPPSTLHPGKPLEIPKVPGPPGQHLLSKKWALRFSGIRGRGLRWKETFQLPGH